MTDDLNAAQKPSILNKEVEGAEEGTDESESEEEGCESDGEEKNSKFKNAARPRDESPESKKVFTLPTKINFKERNKYTPNFVSIIMFFFFKFMFQDEEESNKGTAG